MRLNEHKMPILTSVLLQMTQNLPTNEASSRSVVVKENTEHFDCCICLDKFLPPGAGLYLQCQHLFCKVCLLNHLSNCNNVTEISCPSAECSGEILPTEIKVILGINRDADSRFRLRMLKHREVEALNRFACATRDCPGFKTDKPAASLAGTNNDDLFTCSVCNKINCTKCKRVFDKTHECIVDMGTSTEQSTNDENIKPLIDAGIIMRCPKCRIYLEKRDAGCQFIRCFYCKTDICWLTRGPRWGPAGKGDVSGGCRCGVNGQKCHPDCVNCH